MKEDVDRGAPDCGDEQGDAGQEKFDIKRHD